MKWSLLSVACLVINHETREYLMSIYQIAQFMNKTIDIFCNHIKYVHWYMKCIFIPYILQEGAKGAERERIDKLQTTIEIPLSSIDSSLLCF